MSAALEQAVWLRMQSLGLAVAWGRHLDGVALPNYTLDAPSEMEAEEDTGPNLLDTATVRVHAWATTIEAAKAMLNQVEAAFVKQDLSVVGQTVCQISRGGRDVMIDPDRAEAGEEVWHGVVDLILMIDRAPGS